MAYLFGGKNYVGLYDTTDSDVIEDEYKKYGTKKLNIKVFTDDGTNYYFVLT